MSLTKIQQEDGGAMTGQTLGALNSNFADLYGQAAASNQLGSTGVINLPGSGFISKQISAAGINPGATAADNVLAVFSLPANSFDVAGRGVIISALGAFAATANNKRVKIIFNATTAVVGSTVTGGTTIADTGTVATNNQGFALEATVFKVGAAGANTQVAMNNSNLTGSASDAILLPTTNVAAVENAPILIAVTGNATTVAADIILNAMLVEGTN